MLAPEDGNLKEQSSKVQMPRGFGEEKMFKLHIDWHIQILMIIYKTSKGTVDFKERKHINMATLPSQFFISKY